MLTAKAPHLLMGLDLSLPTVTGLYHWAHLHLAPNCILAYPQPNPHHQLLLQYVHLWSDTAIIAKVLIPASMPTVNPGLCYWPWLSPLCTCLQLTPDAI